MCVSQDSSKLTPTPRPPKPTASGSGKKVVALARLKKEHEAYCKTVQANLARIAKQQYICTIEVGLDKLQPQNPAWGRNMNLVKTNVLSARFAVTTSIVTEFTFLGYVPDSIWAKHTDWRPNPHIKVGALCKSVLGNTHLALPPQADLDRLLEQGLEVAWGNNRSHGLIMKVAETGPGDFKGKIKIHVWGSPNFPLDDKALVCRSHNAFQDVENVTAEDKAHNVRGCAMQFKIADLPFAEQKPTLRRQFGIGELAFLILYNTRLLFSHAHSRFCVKGIVQYPKSFHQPKRALSVQ